jgi:hypothetical protein
MDPVWWDAATVQCPWCPERLTADSPGRASELMLGHYEVAHPEAWVSVRLVSGGTPE